MKQMIMTLMAVVFTTVFQAYGTEYSWANASGGKWGTPSNWSGYAVPQAPAEVNFATASAAEKTAVTLDAAATVTAIKFTAQPGYSIGGTGSFTFDNGSASPFIAQTCGTNAIGVPLAYGNRIFETAVAQGARVELDLVSGNTDIVHGNSEAGVLHDVTTRGGVVIRDASGVNGAIYARNGLFQVGKLGSSIRGIVSGFGLFRYSGTEDYTLNGYYTYEESNWSSSSFEVTDPDVTFTVGGTATGNSGGFYKFGKGTLTFAGTGTNHLDKTTSFGGYAFNTKDMTTGIGAAGSYWPVDGSQRIPLYAGLIVAGGKLAWGVPGQTVIATNHATWIGSTTTSLPGKEYDAELEINGGTTYLKELTLSREHGNSTFGTAEKAELSSKFTLNDGYVSVAGKVYMPNNSWLCSVTHPQLTVTGGELVTGDRLFLGYNQKGGHATFNMNGGTVRIGGALTLCDLYSDGPETTLNVNGGELIVSDIVRAMKGRSTVNLNEGGVLQARSFQADGAGYDNTIVWNGGVYRPSCPWDVSVFGWKHLYVGTKGAVIDMSQMPNTAACVCYFSNVVEKATGVAVDGGIRLRGNNQLRSVRFRPGCSYENLAGGIRVERGGSAYSQGANLASVAVTVGCGGAFVAPWTSVADNNVKVKALTLGDAEEGKPMLLYTFGSGYITPIEVSDSLTVNREVEVAMSDNNQTSYLLGAFTEKTILIAPKGSLRAEDFRLSDRYWQGTASFEVTSYSETMDQLKITSATTGDGRTIHTWTAAGGGAWGAASNWDHPLADLTTEKVLFPSTLAQNIAVSLGNNRSVGILTQAAEYSVTLSDGTLTIGNGGQVSTVAGGSITLPAITSQGTVALNPASNAGKVTLSGSKGATAVSLRSGTLAATPANLGTGTVLIDNSTVSVTGDGTVSAQVTGANGMNLRTDGEAVFAEDVAVTGPFLKSGAGTAYLSGSGTVMIGSWKRGTNADDVNIAATTVPANGDMPADSLGGTFTVSAGKVVVGQDGSPEISTAERTDIGTSFYELDGSGNIVPAELEIAGGSFYSGGDLDLGRNAGRYAKENPALAGKRRDLALTVSGGTVSFSGLYTMADQTGEFRGNTYINVRGGTLTFRGEWMQIGQFNRANSTNFINVYNGRMEFTAAQVQQGPITANACINLYGGELSFAFPLRSVQDAVNNVIEYNFLGGKLKTPYLYRTATNSKESLRWDGGTYAPTTADTRLAQQNEWTANVCSTNGAKFDLSGITSGDAKLTLNQKFTHDAALGATPDGGIELVSAGTLVLSAANEIAGPVGASAGTVRIENVAAVSGGVAVSGTGTIDLGGLAVSATSLRAVGGSIIGGTLSVAGEIVCDGTVVSGLACGAGAVWNCPLTYDSENDRYQAPVIKVAAGGSVTAAGGYLLLDFGLAPGQKLPKEFAVKIAELGTGATCCRIRAVSTGWEERGLVSELRPGDNCTEVWAVLAHPGLAVILK